MTYSKAHYEQNKGYYRAKRRESRDRRRAIVRSAKEKPCADCGVRYPYYVMQFDHRGGKSFTISQNWHKVRLTVLVAEIAKCDVICANCHAVRTYQAAEQGLSGSLQTT